MSRAPAPVERRALCQCTTGCGGEGEWGAATFGKTPCSRDVQSLTKVSRILEVKTKLISYSVHKQIRLYQSPIKNGTVIRSSWYYGVQNLWNTEEKEVQVDVHNR